VVIGQLVGYAVQGIAVATLEEVLSTSNPSAKACRALFEQLGAIDYVTSSVRAVKGDLAMTLVTFEGVRNGSLPLDDLLSNFQGGGGARERVLRAYQSYGGPLMNLDEMAYLRLMEKQTAAFAKPWPDCARVSEGIEREADALPIYRSVITRAVTPVLARMATSRESKKAQIGATQIALALKAYRLRHARHPASLTELSRAGWKLPLDPFTGEPYHYRREGQGFVVWSVGEDGTDQGGKPRLYTGGGSKQFDLPFQCAR
jgi:type II secretory pathway pseudopilin PulG